MSSLESRAFMRIGNTLVPVDTHAEEWLAGIPERKEILVRGSRPRSVAHHRWFFSLLAKVVANTEKFSDPEELLDAVKIAVGHVSIRQMLDGTVMKWPKSISFASLDQDAFKRFVNRALYVINRFLGIDAEALMKEVDGEQGENYGMGHNGGPPIDDEAAPITAHSNDAAESLPASDPAPSDGTLRTPADGAGDLFASPSEAAPTVASGAAAGDAPSIAIPSETTVPAAALSKEDRAKLRKYAEAIAEARTQRTLSRGSAAFLEDHRIADGTPLYDAARRIYGAHLLRVDGKSSPAEAEAAAARVLAA